MISSEVIINKGDNEILTKLKSLFDPKKYPSFIMVVSYVKFPAFAPLVDKVLEMNDGQIIVTTDGHITSPDMLIWLKNKFNNGKNHRAKVFDPNVTKSGFHIKSFIFENQFESLLFVGSSNISFTAFSLNYEMNHLTIYKHGDVIVEDVKKQFNQIFEMSSEITDELIQKYEVEYIEKSKEKENYLNKDNFINKMQLNALSQLSLIKTRERLNKGIQVAATGSGKTRLAVLEMINHIILNSNNGKGELLFATLNKLLIDQTIRSIEEVLEYRKNEIENLKITWRILDSREKILNFSPIHDGFRINLISHTLVSDLVKNENIKTNEFSHIVIDEAHHLDEGEKKPTNIFMLAKRFEPSFMFGLTATPERTNKYNLIAEVFGSTVVSQYDMDEAIDDHLISDFVYYLIDKKEFEDGYEEYTMKNLIKAFNYKILSQIEKVLDEYPFSGKKLRAIAFMNNGGKTNRNLKNVSGYFDGINSKYIATYITGDTSINDRLKIFESLKSDEINTINIIFSDNTLTEGVDIPSINAVLLFRTTDSTIRFKQQIGRGLRKDPANPESHLSVYDFASSLDDNFSDIVNAFSTTHGTKHTKQNVAYGVTKGFENRNFVFTKNTRKQVLDYVRRKITKLAIANENSLIMKEIKIHAKDFNLQISDNNKSFVGGYIKLREFDNMSQFINVYDLANSKFFYTNLFPIIKDQFKDNKNKELLSFAFEMLLKACFSNSSEADVNKLLDLINWKKITPFESVYINSLVLGNKVKKKTGEYTTFYWDELEEILNEDKVMKLNSNDDDEEIQPDVEDEKLDETVEETRGFQRVSKLQSNIVVNDQGVICLNPLFNGNKMFNQLLNELDIYMHSKIDIKNDGLFLLIKKMGEYYRYHQLASFYSMSPMSFKTSTQTIVDDKLVVIKPKFPSGERYKNKFIDDYTGFKYYFKSKTSENKIKNDFAKKNYDVYISFEKSAYVSASAKMLFVGNAAFENYGSDSLYNESIKDLYAILRFPNRLDDKTIVEIEKHIELVID